MLRLHRGEKYLADWLAGLQQHPAIFSDAMPAGFVPVPLLAPSPPGTPSSRPSGTKAAEEMKALSHRSWIPRDEFLAARSQFDRSSLLECLRAAANVANDPEKRLTGHRTAHNRINRITGTTPDAGGLFFVDELWPDSESGLEWDIYLRGELGADEVVPIFRMMGEHGFGRDATLGRGQFKLVDVTPELQLASYTGNRWVSWSRGCASPGMEEPRYRLYTHYGKLGGVWASSEKPFKYPITLWKPGGTFGAPLRAAPFGRLLRGIHPDRPEIVQAAWHFAVPFTEAASQ
jgi:CRISPR-associated protein Csm4